MAHIPDGVLSWPVLAAGGVVAAAAVAIGVRALDEQRIPRVAIVAAAFFALSLFSIPLGPSSVHLLLSGLMGLILGVAIFPAVLAALLLQAVMFGFGGLTSIGVNTINIALPGAIAGMIFAPLVAQADVSRAAFYGGVCAACAVLGTGLLVSLSLYASSPDFAVSSRIVIFSYAPLLVVEALVTGFCVSFVKRVKPELLARTRSA
ncbi:MAG: cobalt transporter CbiM [Beijerinckiaceae bacterium]|nr:cobalt transporter CbiM [Beijerinckiaceae bacterium]